MAQISGLFRIGRDAELRYTASGDAVCGLSLAYGYYDKSAEKNRGSQWIEAAVFGKRAESLAPYLQKGGLVYAVINDPHVETYAKKDGTSGIKLSGKIAEIELAGGKSSERDESQPKAAQEPRKAQDQSKSSGFGDFADDIPF